MAYIFFGSSPADITTDDQGNVIGGITLQVWSQQTGGTRITDLRNVEGVPLAGVVMSNSDAGSELGRIRFQAPDQYTVLYLDRGYGDRWSVTSDRLSVIVAESVTRSQAAITQSADALTASTAAKQSADHAYNTATKIRTDVTAFGAIGDGIKDDREAFQAAIDSNPYGAHVIIPEGTYRIGVGKLLLRAGTWLEAEPGAHIIRSSDDYLLANGLQGIDTSTGYEGAGNIRITGGVWDGNATAFPAKASIMHLAHSHNVLVERAEFRDVAQSHHIEFNSSRNVRVSQCRLLGYVDAAADTRNEAIQLDMAYPGATIIGADDGTPCRDVVIEHCYFGPSDTIGSLNIATGIGSHTVLAEKEHTGIAVRDCTFEAARGDAVHFLQYRDAVIESCRMIDCNKGPRIELSERAHVANNTIIRPLASGIEVAGGRSVTVTANAVAGMSAASQVAIRVIGSAKEVVVTGNVVTDHTTGSAAVNVTASCQRVRVANNILNGAIANNATASTPDANGNIV